ncbi:unnamed protein product [Closterium sp. Yama58-4]|nr:unnamed protein product [Closterium sp. Yama58-4]
MGLVVSQKLASLMHGTLSCHSTLSQDSFLLPPSLCVSFLPLPSPRFPSSSSAPAGSGLGLIVSQKLASLMHGALSCHPDPFQGSSFLLPPSLCVSFPPPFPLPCVPNSSSTPAGSGLGLIVSQKLASLMYGTLSCNSTPSQGSSFRLQVSFSPTSPPFPPSLHPSSSTPAGSGLGLIVSQKLASLMHGTLSCDSAPSQGSSFRLSLSLPFAGRSTHADPADAGADMAAGHASLAPGGMMSCYLSNRVKGVVYSSVGVWSSAEEVAAAPVVPPSLSRSLSASVPAPTTSSAAAGGAAAGAEGADWRRFIWGRFIWSSACGGWNGRHDS